MSIRAEKKGLVATQKKLLQTAKDVTKDDGEIVRAVARGTLIIQRGAMMRVPVDRGLLRNSITPEIIVRENTVRGVVGSNREYAAAQELGTKPYWPPFEPILRWAMRKLKAGRKKSVAWGLAVAVQRKIASSGIKAKKFLSEAYTDNLSKIQRIIEKAVSKTVNK